jgi:hypothetical protein
MLHSMSNIRGLNQMLNDDGCLWIGLFLLIRAITQPTTLDLKGNFPKMLAEGTKVLVNNISCHDCVDNQLTEPIMLPLCRVDSTTKILIGGFQCMVSIVSFCPEIPVSLYICVICLHTLLGVNRKHLQALATVHGHL